MTLECEMKLCTNKDHDQILPYEAFGKNRGTIDGYQGWCKECMKKAGKIARDRNAKVREERQGG